MLLIAFEFIVLSGNAQWTKVSTGVTNKLNSLFFITQDTGWVVGDATLSAPILKTVNGGNTWVLQNSNTLQNLQTVYFVNVNIGFAAGEQVLLKTNDGGNTWNQVNGFADSYTKLFFTTDSVGYLTGSNKIYKTTDQGQNWVQVFNCSCNWIRSIHFPSNNVGYAVDIDGMVYKTIDAGTTWNSLPQVTANWILDVFFVNNTTGFITLWSSPANLALKTTDGGNNWAPLSVGNVQPINSIYFTSSDTGYFAGGNGNGELFNTTNGGTTWTPIQPSLFSFQNLSDIQFVNSQVGYAIDWSGNIYKTENGGNISSVTNILDQSFFKIYPNPFSTYTILQTDLFLKNATLVVENCFGQPVKQIKNINGETITLHRDNLPNGLYFIRLIQDNKIIKVDKLIITD